jgi:hypothetical protein
MCVLQQQNASDIERSSMLKVRSTLPKAVRSAGRLRRLFGFLLYWNFYIPMLKNFCGNFSLYL